MVVASGELPFECFPSLFSLTDMTPTQYRDLTEEKVFGIEIPNAGCRDTPPRNRTYIDPRTYSSLTDAMNQVRVREIPPKELANLDEIGVGKTLLHLQI